jgi:redox-sensitive bicupin YhaK (pirin superfamily)
MTIRSVARVVPSVETLEGAGFLVHRPFPTSALDQFDPFLLLDEMGPMDVLPGEAKGAPDHPHRGFETVTYLLSGRMRHRDSAGHAGELNPGDVQWMTAGSGVVHSEEPHPEFQKTGGRLHGFQLWVNLPRQDKMMKPHYQELPGAQIPEAVSADGKIHVKVLAGRALGAQAAIDTRTPILYLHYRLEPGGRAEQPVPADWNAFAYVVEGRGLFGADSREARDGAMVLFGNDGDAVSLTAPAETGLEALLVAGLPIREPVARYGPFVMNTRAELIQAFEDYQSGRLGQAPGAAVKS